MKLTSLPQAKKSKVFSQGLNSSFELSTTVQLYIHVVSRLTTVLGRIITVWTNFRSHIMMDQIRAV
jgi:hypothetical protein